MSTLKTNCIFPGYGSCSSYTAHLPCL